MYMLRTACTCANGKTAVDNESKVLHGVKNRNKINQGRQMTQAQIRTDEKCPEDTKRLKDVRNGRILFEKEGNEKKRKKDQERD
jgi:hypothetical protein